MFQYLSEKKEEIISYLSMFFAEESKAYSAAGRFGADTLKRLLDFTVRGKMIRGGLVLLGHDLFNGNCYQDAVAVSAAIELLQSALLIHDDIMDRDISRRGEPTLYYQHAQECKKSGIQDHIHVGEALGICSGDTSIFCAYTILSKLSLSSSQTQFIFEKISREMGRVCTAQMLDVFFGASNFNRTQISGQEILDLYRHKTAGYTIALPLSAGARIAGASKKAVMLLESIGEKLGIIFQIKDDELGLLGKPDDIGKPVGSDIREGKKTIFYYILFQQSTAAEQEKLQTIFGNPDIAEHDIDYVRDLLQKNKVIDKINSIVDGLKKEIDTQLTDIDIPNKEQQTLLHSLVSYSITRTI